MDVDNLWIRRKGYAMAVRSSSAPLRATRVRARAETEQAFQRWFIDLFTLLGYSLAYHTYDSRRSARGFPDWCVLRPASASRPARFLVVELKTDKGRIRPEQHQWIDGLRACGIEAYIWRPSQRADIERILLEK